MKSNEEIAYEIVRKFTAKHFPLILSHFDEIWTVAIRISPLRRGKRPERIDTEALSFSGGDVIIQTVIPFVLGVVSSLVADWIYDKIRTGKKSAAILEIEKQARQVQKALGLDSTLTKEIVPYIVEAFGANRNENRIC